MSADLSSELRSLRVQVRVLSFLVAGLVCAVLAHWWWRSAPAWPTTSVKVKRLEAEEVVVREELGGSVRLTSRIPADSGTRVVGLELRDQRDKRVCLLGLVGGAPALELTTGVLEYAEPEPVLTEKPRSASASERKPYGAKLTLFAESRTRNGNGNCGLSIRGVGRRIDLVMPPVRDGNSLVGLYLEDGEYRAGTEVSRTGGALHFVRRGEGAHAVQKMTSVK